MPNIAWDFAGHRALGGGQMIQAGDRAWAITKNGIPYEVRIEATSKGYVLCRFIEDKNTKIRRRVPLGRISIKKPETGDSDDILLEP